MSNPNEVIYRPPGPVANAFMSGNDFVRGIMGPLGSGKSTACVMEILRRANEQKPSPDGMRYSRWAIIRNTYPELKTTTLKTWSIWCPTHLGRLTMDSPIIHRMKTAPYQGEGYVIPGIDIEVIFLALDRDEDVKKLLSLELTGAWINEAREVPKPILDALTGRVGRFPSMKDGGCTWSGIIMDTNPPDDQSWWYEASEVTTPEGWKFFKQPGGLSPEAENIQNLHPDYYKRMVAGKDPDWVKVYVNAEYGFVTEGKPVYPMYRDSFHASSEALEPIPNLPLLLGVDFGLTPAAVIAQKTVDGRWLLLDEFVSDDSGIPRFGENLSHHLALHFPNFDVGGAWGDPAGTHRNDEERTALDILKAHTKIDWKPAPCDNTLTPRLEVVKAALNRVVDGKPGVLVSPKCQMIRKGFAGGYHYKFIATSNGTRVEEKPRKNAYSHPHDALQYLFLGGGEYSVILQKKKRQKHHKNRIAPGTNYKVFN